MIELLLLNEMLLNRLYIRGVRIHLLYGCIDYIFLRSNYINRCSASGPSRGTYIDLKSICKVNNLLYSIVLLFIVKMGTKAAGSTSADQPEEMLVALFWLNIFALLFVLKMRIEVGD